ncbi:methyltransferase [Bifidobacterium sp. UTCIF-37]|uniref:Methyltransferase n=2 Tax=Bifidobacterium callitrichos TaxID=762209 RepID=A0A2T3GCA2_9BIFI|nr:MULTISPECIES: methyltransferase [Bifidobacterium]KAA8817302.1 methyltransferase [Bifidobacterium callitrichos]KFI52886.1 O-methyltransferase [Bifidobacterium callitrichos DSM 23973]PST47108.1 methyltransferase [Bifidobacterium callitrichos]TPF86737.1 methyltransferase [Bifidobacterium sp. UTCIF-37]TPF89880.1 methyltransferase [Bifidobacterium sp. UTCIF-38]
MDRKQYTNLTQAWRYVEDHALAAQSQEMRDARSSAEESGLPQACASQAVFLSMLVRITRARSVIAVGTGSVVDTLELANGLDGEGQLTAVDSSTQGIALVRRAFDRAQDTTSTKLRAVNAPARVFLPRLNGANYDLIVVSGDAGNYATTFEQAPRLLRGHGAIVFTDVLAFEDSVIHGGVPDPADRGEKATAMRALIDAVESDDRFSSTLTAIGTGLLVAVMN